MYEDYMTEERVGGVENKRDPLIWDFAKQSHPNLMVLRKVTVMI